MDMRDVLSGGHRAWVWHCECQCLGAVEMAFDRINGVGRDGGSRAK